MTDVRAGESVEMVLGGPEMLFGVEPVRRLDGGDLASRQDLGPRARDPVAGSTSLGALGVLVDDVLGYAINQAMGGWSVSTEISIDVLMRLPEKGPALCYGRVVHVDNVGALAVGEVLAGTGEVVARCVLRGRLSPLTADPEVVARWHAANYKGVAAAADLDSLLEPDVRAARDEWLITVGHRFVNPVGHLHGGMHLCLLERAGSRAIPELPRTASIRLQMMRGVPLGASLRIATDVLHRGRSLGVVQVSASDSHNRLCSLATVVLH